MIFCIDIDGVLSKKLKWSVGDSYLRLRAMLLNIEPNIKAIIKVNQLFDDGNTIILNTARIWHDYNPTVEWLKKHGIKYHTLIMAKPLADFYIDDKNKSVEEFLSENITH